MRCGEISTFQSVFRNVLLFVTHYLSIDVLNMDQHVLEMCATIDF